MLAPLLSDSLDYNIRWGITGVLAFGDGRFVQVLEGPDAAVDGLFCRIRDDPRHQDVRVLCVAPISVRQFPISSMAYVGLPVDMAPILGLLDAPIMSPRPRTMAVIDALAKSVAG